jgi:hypothetical protein
MQLLEVLLEVPAHHDSTMTQDRPKGINGWLTSTLASPPP